MKLIKGLPKKGDYRVRAHINPLNISTFPFPQHHSYVDWKEHYPKLLGNKVEGQN
jgi:tRNA (guanine-N7-)-methyltransferase